MGFIAGHPTENPQAEGCATKASKFDRSRTGMISWERLRRGAEAMSSWADIPRSFGGQAKGATEISAEVADGSPAEAVGGLG